MSVRRGEIVLLDMPFAQGGGSKIRPALVVQSDHNNGRLSNTIVAAITRNVARATEPTQLLIPLNSAIGRQSGLLADSAVTCENLFTVGQPAVLRTIGHLTAAAMVQVDECLKAALALA